MAIKLLVALTLMSSASAVSYMVQPFPDFAHLSPFVVSPFHAARPFALFDEPHRVSLFDRHLYSSPFSLLKPRASAFSSMLDSMLDGLQQEELEASWTERDEHIEAHLLVRGLEAKDLKAEVSDGVLTVRGDKCRTVIRRSLSLPFDVTDASKIALSMASNGVLTVKVPKATRAPDKTATPLRIVAAEEEKKKAEALPAPTPTPTAAAVEAETLRALEAKFPRAPVPPPSDSSDSPTEAKKTSDEPSAEPRSATETLRKVINTAIGATSMLNTAATGADIDAKNISVEAAAAAPAPETVAAAA